MYTSIVFLSELLSPKSFVWWQYGKNEFSSSRQYITLRIGNEKCRDKVWYFWYKDEVGFQTEGSLRPLSQKVERKERFFPSCHLSWMGSNQEWWPLISSTELPSLPEVAKRDDEEETETTLMDESVSYERRKGTRVHHLVVECRRSEPLFSGRYVEKTNTDSPL